MRLTSFAVKGILAYQHAEARVNAADLPSGLIALTGPNGHGKTTLLETPLTAAFRSFPSRPDRAVMDYAGTSDAFLETSFDLDGRGAFRIRCNIDGPRRKTSAVLEFLGADGTVTPLNDGKVSTFDAAIAALLPPPELLLASVFGVQTQRGSFVTLDTAARKQLFAQLLGLKYLEEMAERAKQAEKRAGQALIPLQAARQVLARDARPEIADELAQQANQLQIDGGALEHRRQQLQQDLVTIEAELATLQAAAAAHGTARTKADLLDLERTTAARDHATVLAALDELTVTAAAERSTLQEATAHALRAFDTRLANGTSLRDELARIDADLATAVERPTQRVAKNRDLLGNAHHVQAAVEATDAARVEIAALGELLAARTHALDGHRCREVVLIDALHDLGAADLELTRARTDAALLETAPFGDQCAPCGFMVQALTARHRIPGLEEHGRARQAADAEYTSVRQLVESCQQEIKDVRRLILTREAEMATHAAWVAFVEPLRHATEKIGEYEAQITERRADAARQRVAAEQRERARVADLHISRAERAAQHDHQVAALTQRVDAQRLELADHGDSLAKRLTELGFALATLHDELARTQDAAEQAAAQSALLRLRRREWDDSTAALADVTSRRRELERRREQYAERTVELHATEARIAAIEQHRREWDALAKACARDGLQTIEIDAAGPTVSAYTNRILRDCYGTRFTVEIVTQEAKRTTGKDGSTMKETFELHVYDAERGGPPRDIADLSGGEKVIVEEALKSAIALLVNDRNVQRIRTCWRDETTGPLDDHNRARYMTMLRSVHTLGGFWQTFFVTHDDEAAVQADAQLHVHDGQVDVLLPPYGATS